MTGDRLLEALGYKYEELNAVERETYLSMAQAVQESVLTIEKIRDSITSMRASVEQELTTYDLGSKQDMFLKARLRNYMLLEGMLQSPEKARQALEQALGNLKKK
jgi:hypothetical protein